jgi:hypothetical protein
MAKAYYHNLPTVLCKILGIYTIRYDNKETGKKATENVVVMENIFYEVMRLVLWLLDSVVSYFILLSSSQRNITKTFDLKGSSRARYVELNPEQKEFFDDVS